jgi:hypothetical protein
LRISKECKDCDCPYGAKIEQQNDDIRIIKNALVGPDLQSGLVKRVTDMESRLKNRWTPKDWGALCVGIAALVTAAITYWNSIPH